MQKEHLLDLEDAGVVIRDKKGKIRLKQAVPLTRIGALGGAAWGGWIGAFAGILMLNPLLGLAAGAAVGAGAGAISGALSDYGISEINMPLAPEKVWRAIRDAEKAKAA